MADRRARHLLLLLIAGLGVALRVIAFSPFAIHHPDEALQYLEQAHRVAFGTGLVPWEYRLGMRSWLLPVLLAGPMRMGDTIAPGSLLFIVLARVAAAVLAFLAVPASYLIGKQASTRHGLVAMAVMAVWYESVFFSVHVLTEPLAVATFFMAAALLTPAASRARLAVGGALLMFSAVLRIHYAPAITAFALVQFRVRWSDWRWLAIGGAAAALLSSAVDMAMGQMPFAWVFNNVFQNVVADKASSFGRLGPEAYPEMLWLHWQVALVPIVWLSALAARRFPALAIAAVVNLIVHLAIGHKEHRFILLSGQIMVLLAAFGSVDLLDRFRKKSAEPAWFALPLGLWCAASLLLAFAPTSDPGWRRFEGGFQLARRAAEGRACGVALVGGSYWATGGQTFLGRTPLYSVVGRNAAEEDRQLAVTGYAYDAIIAPASRPVPIPYRRTACRGADAEPLCMAVRRGGCRRDALSDTRLMQRMMEAAGR